MVLGGLRYCCFLHHWTEHALCVSSSVEGDQCVQEEGVKPVFAVICGSGVLLEGDWKTKVTQGEFWSPSISIIGLHLDLTVMSELMSQAFIERQRVTKS